MRRSGTYAGAAEYDQIFRAVGDPHRIRILGLLKDKEMSAGEILAELDIVQSTLSHHMKNLVEAGLVSAERRGKWTYYKLEEMTLVEAGNFLAHLPENDGPSRRIDVKSADTKSTEMKSADEKRTDTKITDVPKGGSDISGWTEKKSVSGKKKASKADPTETGKDSKKSKKGKKNKKNRK